MDRNLENLLFAVAFVLAALYATFQLMVGIHLISGIKVLVCLSPILIAAMASFQRYWAGIGIALLTMGLSLPLPVISRFRLGMLFGGAVVLFVIAQTAMQKSSRPSIATGPALICAAGGIAILRVLYDRPGSARFGETGGIGEAVSYVLAFLVFWAFSRFCYWNYNSKNFLRPLIVVVVISCMVHAAKLVPAGLSPLLYSLFGRPFWLASAIAVAVVYYWIDKKKFVALMPFIHPGILGGILSIAALSAHRSRPLFAVAIILSAAWIYGRFKRAAVMICIMGAVGIGGLLVFSPSGLPTQVKRSLSTVVSVDPAAYRAIAHDTGLSYEVGWSSGFRAAMYRIAWGRIREHPVTGTGFNFSLQNIMDEMYELSSNTEFKGIGGLALAGGYHNSILTLAVFCGLPAAIMVCVGMIMIIRRFLFYARSLPVSADKVVATSLVGFFTASAGQMLMNGGSFDMFACLLLLGTMVGIMQKKEALAMSTSPDPLSANNLREHGDNMAPIRTYIPV